MLHPALTVAALCGWALIGVIGIQVALAILRAFIPVVPATVARTVVNAISAALRRGDDLAPAIAATAPRLRWPYAWHARSAAAELAADPGAGIIVTLARYRLIPPALADSGTAAERLGVPGLLRWAGRIAGQPSWSESLLRPLTMYAGVAVVLLGLIIFVQTFITPKFHYIAIDLGLKADWRLALLPQSEYALWMGLALGTTLVGALGAWRWRRMRRMLAAEVILAGTASGASEGEIAAAFAGEAAGRAGAAGDFPALAAAAGWPDASDPTELAQRLAAAEEQAHRQRTGVRIGLQISTPIVLAIPVWLLASGVFGFLTHLIYATAAGDPS